MGSETLARPPKGRTILSEDFRRFLAWLAPEPERAAVRYNEIHAALARIFACRGCERPYDLADETLDRVIRKVDTVAPGFDYADYETGDRAALIAQFPQHRQLIERLSH